MHRGLTAPGNEWVSLHRGARADEPQSGEIDTTATNELMMRNQYRAWVDLMAPPSDNGPSGSAAASGARAAH